MTAAGFLGTTVWIDASAYEARLAGAYR